MKSIFEQIGGTYTKQGDYCLPNLYLPPEEERPIGIYGQRRLRYLKQHHKILYYNLLTSGKLHSHLADVEEEAQALFSRLVKEYAEKEGVTEQLKSADQKNCFIFQSMVWLNKIEDNTEFVFTTFGQENIHSSLQGFLCILGVLSLREFQYAKNQLTGKRFFRFLF